MIKPDKTLLSVLAVALNLGAAAPELVKTLHPSY
jgi:hypothetical protein